MIRSLLSFCSRYQTRKSSCSLREKVLRWVSSTFLTICIEIVEAPRRKPPCLRFRLSALRNMEVI